MENVIILDTGLDARMPEVRTKIEKHGATKIVCLNEKNWENGIYKEYDKKSSALSKAAELVENLCKDESIGEVVVLVNLSLAGVESVKDPALSNIGSVIGRQIDAEDYDIHLISAA